MCSPSPGSGVGRGVICRAAPGGATATAGLFAAALAELGPELGPELVLLLVAAERAAGLAGLGLRSSRSAPGCVRACALVAAVAATTRVNRVLAGIGMTTRQLAPCLSSGRANQHARAFHSCNKALTGPQWQQAKGVPGVSLAGRTILLPESSIFRCTRVARGYQVKERQTSSPGVPAFAAAAAPSQTGATHVPGLIHSADHPV